MEKRIELTVTYKSKRSIKCLVNYVNYDAGAIYFTVDSQCGPVYEPPVRIPLENIEKFEINKVMCNGWTVNK